MKKMVRVIVLTGVVLVSAGFANASVGGSNPTPRPPQSELAMYVQVLASVLGV